MTMSPRRQKQKTVGVSGVGSVANLSEPARYVQRAHRDVVVGIGPVTSLGLPRLVAEPVDLVGIAIVDPDIPLGQDVAPLQAAAVIKPNGGGGRRIACGTEEQVQRYGTVETVAIVEDACAEERDAVNVIRLDRRSQILVRARGATCTHCQMWAEAVP